MAMPVYIQDPLTGQRMAVSKDGLLLVTSLQGSSQDVPAEVLTRQKQLRTYLSTSAGATDLNINAAAAPVEFNLTAEPTRTMWVTGLRVLFNGTSLEMNTNDFRRFGAATAASTPLTNGVKLIVAQGGIETQFFVTPVTRMGGFFDYADSYLNILNAVSAQADFLYFDFKFDVPVVLPPGTVDRVAMTVNDNLTAIDLFRVIVRGYQETVVA